MAWYYGTYSCGHEGRTNIIGPTKNRQWISDRHFEGLCAECYEAKKIVDREKANTEAAEKAKETELPELEGTEKQVAWANTLRQVMIDETEKWIEKMTRVYEGEPGLDSAANEINNILNFILTTKTKAFWYIDNRTVEFESILKISNKEMNTLAAESAPEAKDVINEATVYPENAISDAIAEIKITENQVTAEFERNDKFIKIVKMLDYNWSGKVWSREISQTTGSSYDRAAELGNKLLNAGFPIKLMDNEARQKAINGTYEPECKRWIYHRNKGDYKDWLVICWTDDSDMYNKARSLPGSRWDKPSVVVKPEHFKEIEEFAGLYGFRFTPLASDIIKKAKEAKENATVVTPVKVQNQQQKDGLKEILNSGSDILDDLKD